jgi:hypothetical protein
MQLGKRVSTAYRSLLDMSGLSRSGHATDDHAQAIEMNEVTLAASQHRADAPLSEIDDGQSATDEVGPVLASWAMEELATFRLNRLDARHVEARLTAINAGSRSIHVYRVSGGSVELLEKPAGMQPNANGARRALAYLDFFREVCASLPVLPPFHLAFETADKVTERVDVPVFAFQKRRGETSILLPDIDFLNHGFYAAPKYRDPLDYGSKRAEAIFVGSTSGGQVTPQAARNCTLPRLRAARHFDGNPRVAFLLPQIVQTSSEEAAAILRAMAFCQVSYVPFEEQLLRRFVISMDGNGATCSRVVITLKSNSVLLKYHSDDLLYYFRRLQPWLHYVPVHKDTDIDAILDMEQEDPAFFEKIAENGRQFAETYLSRDAVFSYTADLFRIYAGCFSADAGTARPVAIIAAPAPSRVPAKMVLMAHMQGIGDAVANGEGWVGNAQDGRLIEGFSLSSSTAMLDRQFSYRCLADDGTPHPSTPGGRYCGTRGKNTPIYGFVIDTAPGAADAPPLDYEGIFRDGFSSGILTPGHVCKSPGGAPLVAMRIGVAKG